MDKVKFGLIGCGAAGKLHLAAMKSTPQVDIALVVDSDPLVAQRVGEQEGVPWTTNADALFSSPSIEAVSIAVPHFLHFPLAKAALGSGKHVLLEKPFTLSQVRRVHQWLLHMTVREAPTDNLLSTQTSKDWFIISASNID